MAISERNVDRRGSPKMAIAALESSDFTTWVASVAAPPKWTDPLETGPVAATQMATAALEPTKFYACYAVRRSTPETAISD